MNFHERIRKFLGLFETEKQDQYDFRDPDWYWSDPSVPRPPKRRVESPFHNGLEAHFNFFTDPLEMHKYFEQQMNNMIKNFGFFDENFPNFFNPLTKNIPQGQQNEPAPGDLRNQFLKPSFERPSRHEKKKDEDIDGMLNITDWVSVFNKENNSTASFHKQIIPKTKFFGQSVISTTVANSDGSVEIHHTVRDSLGNEETTITRRIGDKEYSVTKHRNKDGKEEVSEDFVTLDEKDKFVLKKKNILDWDESTSWFSFDQFFK